MKKLILVLLMGVLFLTGCGRPDKTDYVDRRDRYQTVYDVKRHILSDEKLNIGQLDAAHSKLMILQEYHLRVIFKGEIEKYLMSDFAHEFKYTSLLIEKIRNKRLRGE
ncbi:MAG: hypothetical protein ACRC5T_03230 [Cetobacterium sp.]